MSPYIDKARRAEIDAGMVAQTAGELCYRFYWDALRYRRMKGDSFQTFAEIVAALEQAKDEIQRRVVHPYEDGKLMTEGDIRTLAPVE